MLMIQSDLLPRFLWVYQWCTQKDYPDPKIILRLMDRDQSLWGDLVLAMST